MAISPTRKLLEAQCIGASQLIALFPEFAMPYHMKQSELAAGKWAAGGDKTFAEAIGYKEFEGNKYTKAGELMEPVTASQFVEQFPETKRLHFKIGKKTFREVSLINTKKTYKNLKSGRMVTPDRLINPKPGKYHVGIECKFTQYNTENKNGDPEEGGLPEPATLVQIAGQMDYFNSQIWFAGVCVGAVDYWFYLIERDYNMIQLIDEVRSRSAKFIDILRKKDWQSLLMDDTDIWKRLAFQHFPKPADGKKIVADDALRAMYKEWGELAIEVREKKKRLKFMRNDVEMRMGDAKYVTDDMGNHMFNRYAVKESTRQMTIGAHCRVNLCGVKKNGSSDAEDDD